MLYCRLIYVLSILCVRLTIKVKVGIPESFKVGWYPPKKLGRVTLKAAILVSNLQRGRVLGLAAVRGGGGSIPAFIEGSHGKHGKLKF